MSIIPAFKLGFLNGWIFMSAFIIQLLLMMSAGSKVMSRSHVAAEVRENSGRKYISALANFVWFLALVYSLFLPFLLGTVWFYIGLLLFIIGLLILFFATVNFIRTPADQIISQGVYRFFRHPMYVATFLICFGCGFATGSLLFIFISIIMIYCFHKEALIEESYCLEQYGESYQNYMNQVPRWGIKV